MAWGFKDTDLGLIMSVLEVHPDRDAWLAFVESETADLDLLAVTGAVRAIYATNGHAYTQAEFEVIEELKRIADTDAEITIERTDENGTPGPVTFAAKAKGFIG